MRRQAITRSRWSPRSDPRAIGGLAHELGRIEPAGPRHVAQVLDRMHARQGTSARRDEIGSTDRIDRIGRRIGRLPRPRVGGPCPGLATIAGRDDQTAVGSVASPRSGREARELARVADDVPPRERGARSVHQRELVGAEDGDPDPRGPPRLGRPRQLHRHRRRGRHEVASSGRSSTSSWCSAIPTASIVKAMGLERLPAFVFIRVDGEVVATAEGWNSGRVARGRRRDRRPPPSGGRR